MKTSTEIQSLSQIVGIENAVELIAESGFDAWDFSLSALCEYDYENKTINGIFPGKESLKIARKLKQIGLDNGIFCNQSHAPCPSDWDSVRSTLKYAIEYTAEAGGKICVIHPCCYATFEENIEMYANLLTFAKECDVKIATENMFFWDNENEHAFFAPCATPDSFIEYLDVINDEYFVACLDIGHAEMRGIDTSAEEMILKLGNRIQSLHLHDNDKWHDLHQIPFSMDIDYNSVVRALKKIDYKGEFTLEACSFLKDFDAENVRMGVEELYGSARRLAEMFECDN